MSWKRIAAFAAVVLIGAAFLAGYRPERRLRTAAQEESVKLRQQLDAAEARVRMGELLGQAIAIREVVMRQNYGQAQELSSAFFDSVRRKAAATPLAEFRSVLNDVLSRRDSVTASLAKADTATLEALRMIEVQIRRALGYPVFEEAAATQIGEFGIPHRSHRVRSSRASASRSPARHVDLQTAPSCEQAFKGHSRIQTPDLGSSETPRRQSPWSG